MAETAGGLQVHLSGEEGIVEGDHILLSLRPESLVILDDNYVEANAHYGIVEEAIYLGDSIRYRIILEGGDSVIVKQANPPGTVVYGPGERLGVSWDAADAERVVG